MNRRSVLAVLGVAGMVIPAIAAPTANAATGDSLGVTLGSGNFFVLDNGTWYDHWISNPYFTLDVTDNAQGNGANLTVLIAIPGYQVSPYGNDVTGYDGTDWSCVDVQGGISCTNTDLVVPGESWPTLTVHLSLPGYQSTDSGNIQTQATDDSGHNGSDNAHLIVDTSV